MRLASLSFYHVSLIYVSATAHVVRENAGRSGARRTVTRARRAMPSEISQATPAERQPSTLKKSFAEICEWAAAAGLGQTLRRLLIAAGAAEDWHLNVCLQYLIRPNVRAILRDWATDDKHCAELIRLSDALVDNPQLLVKRSAPSAAEAQSRQQEGKVADLRIILCLSVRRPSAVSQLQTWFDQLRLWIVIQGFIRAATHEIHDLYVEEAADRLRLAGDGQGSPDSPKWIQRLEMKRAVSMTTLNFHLKRTAENTKAPRGPHRDFLNALRNLAQELAKPAIRPPSVKKKENPLLATVLALPRSESDHQPHQPAWSWGAAGDEEEAAGDGPFGATAIAVKEDDSPSRRLLTGRGHQIRSAEAIQFLPWSWDTPTSLEERELVIHLTQWQNHPHESVRLLALLCRIAMLTSRSLAAAQHLLVAQEPGTDWAITPDLRTLHRISPRRVPGWRASEAALPWLQPLANAVRIDLKQPHAYSWADGLPESSLTDRWHRLSPRESAEAMFTRLCAQVTALRRLSSGRLRGLLAKCVYERTSDAVLAQVLSAGPRTALGGNSAYASWPFRTVEAGLLPVLAMGAGHLKAANAPDVNAAGSELDPQDRLIRDQVVSVAAERIRDLAPNANRWVEHHNAVVVYVSTALLAATGARPVDDPFESPADFDWNACRAFISDKVLPGRSGRLVPLPQPVVRLLEHYRIHLHRLADQLQWRAPPLAREISVLADGKESTKLAFLFFLRTLPSLQWDSVTASSLWREGKLPDALPANFLRHRLSARLRAAKVDAEVIDSILGHADQGVLTHGAFSPRSWFADMKAAASVLGEAYAALGFSETFPLTERVETREVVVDQDALLPSARRFGDAAREHRRIQQLLRQRAIAREICTQAANGRPFDKLTPGEWEDLALRLLTIDGRTPHPYGRARYEVLHKLQVRRAEAMTFKVRRIFVFQRDAASPFRAEAVGCEELMEQLQQWYDCDLASIPNSRLGLRKPLVLAAIDLILFSRVTNRRLLRDILVKDRGRNTAGPAESAAPEPTDGYSDADRLEDVNQTVRSESNQVPSAEGPNDDAAQVPTHGPARRNFRIIQWQGHAYIEHHPLLADQPSAPVVRYRITRRCAHWLEKGYSSGYSVDARSAKLPAEWRVNCPLTKARLNVDTFGELVTAIASIVEQVNFVHRPGMIAGYCAGSVVTSALPHADWLLYTRCLVPDDDEAVAERTAQPPGSGRIKLPSLVSRRDWTNHKNANVDSAKRMVAKIRKALSAYHSIVLPADEHNERADNKAGEAGAAAGTKAEAELKADKRNAPSGTSKDNTKQPKRIHRDDLARELARHVDAEARTVSSCIWSLGTWIISQVVRGRTKSAPYRISTLLRYLTSLSRRFIEVGNSFDIFEADAERLTNFYDEVLELNRELDISYVAARLQEFHAFMQSQYEVEEVDWGELDCGSQAAHGSPGLIGLEQHLNTLSLLAPAPLEAPLERLAAAFLQILSFRFGLRGHEAIGLRSEDLRRYRAQGRRYFVVHVRSHGERNLKTAKSQRIVPQLEPFEDAEASIFDAFISLFGEQRRKYRSFSLFSMDRTGQRLPLQTVTGLLNRALRKVHEGRLVSTHKGRHAFASRLSEAVLGEWLRPPATPGPARAPGARTRQMILGSKEATRRAPWAICRALGHSRPEVTFKSYVHLLPMWADEWNAGDISRRDERSPVSKAWTDLNFDDISLRRWQPVVPPPEAAPAPTHHGLAAVVDYLANLRDGTVRQSAIRSAGISPALAVRVERALQLATPRVADLTRRDGRAAMTSLLLHISDVEWDLVSTYCKSEQVQKPDRKPSTPGSVARAVSQVSPYALLLMWEQEHFRWMADFVRTLKLAATEVEVRSTPCLSPRVEAYLASEDALTALKAPPERVHWPIDAVFRDNGDRVTHRCGLSWRPGSSKAFTTRHGFVMLWAIYAATFCPKP
jgi:site-specific recombinase XerD